VATLKIQKESVLELNNLLQQASEKLGEAVNETASPAQRCNAAEDADLTLDRARRWLVTALQKHQSFKLE
jgi:hypothetical protein